MRRFEVLKTPEGYRVRELPDEAVMVSNTEGVLTHASLHSTGAFGVHVR